MIPLFLFIELSTYTSCFANDMTAPDEAELSVNADMALLTEHGQCNLRQRCSIWSVQYFPADLKRPARSYGRVAKSAGAPKY